MMSRLAAILMVSILVAGTPPAADAQEPDVSRALAREILTELVAIETTEEAGRTVEAAEAVARRLVAAGFPEEDVQILGPRPDLGNLVIRYRGDGTGGEPILLMAHMDVVPAESELWTTDPFQLTERGGYLYGRGSVDNKTGVTAIVTNFLRWRAEGWVPSRDVIAVISADEESTWESMSWIVAERRNLVDAEFALNTDGDYEVSRDGVPIMVRVDAAEKVFVDYRITARSPGGHSSEPTPENAIYKLAHTLVSIADYDFPVTLNEITREYFRLSAQNYPPEIAADMRALSAEPTDLDVAERVAATSHLLNAQLRTTCVATLVDGGVVANLLPQSASATINCRIFPGVDPGEVDATLRRLIEGPGISLEVIYPALASPPSFLTPPLREALEDLVSEMFPTARMIPNMTTGATEAVFLRNVGIPVYGLSGIFVPEGDDRSHGNDERVGIEAFHDAVEFWYRLVKRLASEGF